MKTDDRRSPAMNSRRFLTIERVVCALAAAVALTLGAAGASVSPSVAPSLGDAERACLGCHGQEGITRTFAKGEPQPLHVSADAFAGSVHAPLGCAACHGEVDLAKHPAETRPPLPAKDTCFGCHDGALAAHARWLPNTKMHFEIVACAACHAPSTDKRIELVLLDSATQREVVWKDPKLGDAPLDPLQLRATLIAARGELAPAKVTVSGRLRATGTQAHGVLPKARAINDCATCHSKGSNAFRQVTLSIRGPGGERYRYEAQPEVLHALASVDSVGGFYAMGGTRIGLLDVALGLALVGGISAPLGHLVMRKLARRKEGKP